MIKNFQCVNISSKDPKALADFYRLIGAPVFVENGCYDGWNIGGPENGGYVCCWDENVWGKSAAGFVTIVLNADDVQKTYEEIRAKGLDIDPPAAAGWGGLELAFQDPDGNRVMILQEGRAMRMKLAHVKLGVSDLARSVEWYTQVLGFEVDSCYPKDNPCYYDFKGCDSTGAAFSIGQAEHGGIYHGGRTNFEAADVDALWESLKDKATVVEPLWDTPWGTRKFTIADPDGNELGFTKPC